MDFLIKGLFRFLGRSAPFIFSVTIVIDVRDLDLLKTGLTFIITMSCHQFSNCKIKIDIICYLIKMIKRSFFREQRDGLT